MKKLFLVGLLFFAISFLTANDWESNVFSGQSAYTSINSTSNFRSNGRDPERTGPEWTFSTLPTDLLTSYYDYMIGSYNGLPLRLVPDAQGGGYFMTFHGKQTSTGQRKVFVAYISSTGVLDNVYEISPLTTSEGFPGMDYDPVTATPFYAWHTNFDPDAQYEVFCAWDKMVGGIPGQFSTPNLVVNNPTTISTITPVTTDNEFLWPYVQVGPSPNPGMRRLYVETRNAKQHGSFICENPLIAYADYNPAMLENDTPLVWSYTSIPMMDDWNSNASTNTRTACSLVVGNDGRIYYMGFHTTPTASVNDIDVFVCDNYGAGTWTHHASISRLPSWNPPTNFGDGPGYITNSSGVPLLDSQIYWTAVMYTHINAVMDNNNELHCIGLWKLSATGHTFNDFMAVKDIIYNVDTQLIRISEIYPVAGTSSDDIIWQPWDSDGDGLVDEYGPDGTPMAWFDFYFPYWNHNACSGNMRTHYNNFKISEANAQGWISALWQNSCYARMFNYYNDPQYAAFANVPEIEFCISLDNGASWSKSILINSVDYPQFAGITPMWVYPADRIRDMGILNGKRIGRLGILFYHDNTWGAYSLTASPLGPNDGGIVKFMEIDIDMNSFANSGILGTIREAGTNQPIANALISVEQYSAISDSAGVYKINLMPGTYSVTVTAPGFVSQTVNGVIVIADNHFPVHFDLLELAAPPADVIAAIQTGNLSVLVEWQLPSPGKTYQKSKHVTALKALPDRSLLGFVVYRLLDGQENNEAVWTLISVNSATETSYLDGGWQTLPSGLYLYAVKAMYTNDNFSPPAFSNTVEKVTAGDDNNLVPAVTRLISCSPNPFTEGTNISYELKSASPVRFDFYNISGQKVRTLIESSAPKGVSQIHWNASNDQGKPLSSGVYFLRMKTADKVCNLKLVIIR